MAAATGTSAAVSCLFSVSWDYLCLGRRGAIRVKRLEVEQVVNLQLVHPLVVAVQRAQVVVACTSIGQGSER